MNYYENAVCFSTEDHERRRTTLPEARRVFAVHLDGVEALMELERENTRLRQELERASFYCRNLTKMLRECRERENSQVQETS